MTLGEQVLEFEKEVSDEDFVNKEKVDSGLRLSSINEVQTFGDVYMSYQKDVNKTKVKKILMGSKTEKDSSDFKDYGKFELKGFDEKWTLNQVVKVED